MDTSCEEAKADIIREFLEVSFHAILYTRGIYPHALFQLRKKYNTLVKMCYHPALNQYIKNSLQAVHTLILQNAIEQVKLSLVAPDRTPLDCYSFLLQKCSFQPSIEDAYLVELEDSLRAALLKIYVSDSISQTILPPDSLFMISVYTHKQATADLRHDQELQGFPWVEVDKDSINDSQPIVPLKMVDAGWFKMEIQMKTANKPTVTQE